MRGRIFWAHLDKRRPVVVVSAERRNELARDVIVVPCSTHVRLMRSHVALRRGEGGLRQASIAKCEQIVTISKDALAPTALGAPLSAARMHEIERGILSALGIVLA
jgi:mRNA-degrading endonuclease toxin of MazEF toxin-antitoxin module